VIFTGIEVVNINSCSTFLLKRIIKKYIVSFNSSKSFVSFYSSNSSVYFTCDEGVQKIS